MEFRRISLIKSIDKLAQMFPAVALFGARQVGKTSILRLLYERSGGTFIDLESYSDVTRVSADPEFFLQSIKLPLYVDEAQLLPSLFSALRVAIDRDRKSKGRYFLSGSSSPELLGGVEESLAGRIGLIEIEPLTLEEMWTREESPLYDIVAKNDHRAFEVLTPRYTQEQIFTSFFYGGYPEPLSMKLGEDKEVTLWFENYIKTYVHQDIRSFFPGLDITTYRRFVDMLAYSSGTILNLSDFARSLSVSQPTVRNYLSIAEGTFVWRTLPAYERSHLKQNVRSPRGHLRDSGLISSIHRLVDENALLSHPLVGRAWEVFVTEEILRNLQNRLISVKSSYFRTRAGMEVDLILEGGFGTLPIEIKLGTTAQHQDVRWLKDFIEKQKLPYGLLINNARNACWLTDNIFQLPATYL
jgi:uncharacterized protein